MSALLELQDFSVFLTDEQPILSDISLNIARSEVVGLMGESGSGKTSLALALLGFRKWKGHFVFQNRSITIEQNILLRGKSIAMIFQEPLLALNPSETCFEQVTQVMRTHQSHLSEQQIIENVQSLFSSLKLEPLEETTRLYPHQFSGGMRQRAMIAMALASNAELILADEPSTALDAQTQNECLSILCDHVRKYKKALLMIHHDFEVVQTHCDRIIRIADGTMKTIPTSQSHSPKFNPSPSRTPGKSLLSFQNLSLQTKTGKRELLTQLDIREHEIIQISGTSGSGKSSILRMMAGLRSVANAEKVQKDLSVQMDPQIIFQDSGAALNSSLRLKDQFPRKFEGDKLSYLKKVGLDESFLERFPSQLSGGQKQRFCIARALATHSRILLCDEVTASLDTDSKNLILRLLHSLYQDEGLSLVLISHEKLPESFPIHKNILI